MVYTSVSALQAASHRHTSIANNIANINTTAWSNHKVIFSNLVAGNSGSNSVAATGVNVVSSADPNEQGALQSTGRELDLGISGKGMFVYANSDDKNTQYSYSRAGHLKVDKSGNIVNSANNYQLMGYATDSSGNLKSNSTGTLKTLSQLNINQASQLSKPQATSAVSGKIQLPVDSSQTSYSNGTIVYDSLGKGHELIFTWTKDTTVPNQ